MNQDLFHRLLEYYHIDESQYQKITAPVSAESFALGHNFDHINEAVAMVNDVMSHNGKIRIYGDYDADGIMGTSILVKMFAYKNYEASYYIPSRYIDGYGLTLNHAQEAIDDGIELMICVDNGVAAFEPIKLLKDNGVKVLVLDHHEIQDEVPVADYILHPAFDHFGETASSGAFVAFNFSRVFLNRFDKYLSTLASISLISDMMPLLEYNRELLRIVFSNYQELEFLQLDLLKENEPFNEVTIGMKIAPKINSIGRMLTDTSPNKLVDYFTTSDKEKILNYIDWINEVNNNRKELSKNSAGELGDINLEDKGIVYITDAKEGILGLIANNILNAYHLPVVVLTKDEEKGFYKGSARAPQGFSIVDAFKSCSEFMLAGGGHAMAGGCTIMGDKIEEFKKAFIDYANTHPLEKVEEVVVELGLTEINKDNYDLINSFSPFGESWPSPLFVLEKIATRALFFSKNREHIFTQIGQKSRIVGFNFTMDEVRQVPFVDLIGVLKTNTYMNVTSIEFNVKKLIKRD